MKNENLDVKSIFKDAVVNSSLIQAEFLRYTEIEKRIINTIDHLQNEIKKTEQIRNYNSILGEALNALDEKIKYLKVEANKYSIILESKSIYDVK